MDEGRALTVDPAVLGHDARLELKRRTSWFVWRGSDGITRWLSPTNRRYDKPPDPCPGAVMQTANDPPPY